MTFCAEFQSNLYLYLSQSRDHFSFHVQFLPTFPLRMWHRLLGHVNLVKCIVINKSQHLQESCANLEFRARHEAESQQATLQKNKIGKNKHRKHHSKWNVFPRKEVRSKPQGSTEGESEDLFSHGISRQKSVLRVNLFSIILFQLM